MIMNIPIRVVVRIMVFLYFFLNGMLMGIISGIVSRLRSGVCEMIAPSRLLTLSSIKGRTVCFPDSVVNMMKA